VKCLAAGVVLPAVLALGGSVRGRIGAPDIDQVHYVSTRLISIGPVLEVYVSSLGPKGAFQFLSVKAGSYILEGKIGDTRIFFQAVNVAEEADIDVGSFLSSPLTCNPPDCFADSFGFAKQTWAPQILDVCTALKNYEKLSPEVIVVGVLRELDGKQMSTGRCDRQLKSGGHSWVNGIGLPDLSASAGFPDLSQIPGWKRVLEPEKQLAHVAKTIRRRNPGFRVAAVYGSVSYQLGLDGSQRCKRNTCTPEIQFPPADLLEIKGFREIK